MTNLIDLKFNVSVYFGFKSVEILFCFPLVILADDIEVVKENLKLYYDVLKMFYK